MAGKTEKHEQSETVKSLTEASAPTTEQIEKPGIFDNRKKSNVAGFDLSRFSVKKTLTKNLFSIAHSRQLIIKCTSEIYEQKLPVSGRAKQEDTDTKLVDIVNMETGDEGALICNALIVKAFETAGGSLTGRVFGIREGGIKEGKKYRSVDMVELQA
jgi:hypothetical protein